jgi:hypothetical protein
MPSSLEPRAAVTRPDRRQLRGLVSLRGHGRDADRLGRLTVDVDSFVAEVHGHANQGAAFG